MVRWLRPDYQVPRFGDRVEGDLTLDVLPDEDDGQLPDHLPEWPSDPVEQLTALRAVVAEKLRTVEQAARRFKGAVRAEVEKHLNALEVLRVGTEVEEGKWRVRGGGGGGGGRYTSRTQVLLDGCGGRLAHGLFGGQVLSAVTHPD